MADRTVRLIRDDEFRDALDVVRTAFLRGPASEEEAAGVRPLIDTTRMVAGFDDDGRMCATSRVFASRLTVPGGDVAAGAVSAVGVLPTHRRQGHLTRMMRALFDDSAARDEPVQVLIAAEYPIYGRFGFGPATEACRLRLDASARWRSEPTGSVELVDGETFAKVAEQLYDRVRRETTGHMDFLDRATTEWRAYAGLDPLHDGHDDERRNAPKVVWRDRDGEVQATTAYSATEGSKDNRPAGRLRADLLVAATAEAEHELLRFLASVDWVTIVDVGLRAIDDPAPLALVDGRMAVLADHFDHLWLRVLDVPAALTARRYSVPVDLVIEVDDPGGYASGRFRLDGGPDGAECGRTDAEPDLAVPAPALGAAYLGGTGWARLAAAGWVDERTPGAVDRAAIAFSTSRAPWAAVGF
jgi:predicted acetyltransferase